MMIKKRQISEKGKAVIREITTELAYGAQYFNREGKRLTTVREVLICIRNEGTVRFQHNDPIESGLYIIKNT